MGKAGASIAGAVVVLIGLGLFFWIKPLAQTGNGETEEVKTEEDSGYFAYYHSPRQGFQSSYNIFLSKAPCQSKANEGWKLALFDYYQTIGTKPACWRTYDDDPEFFNLCYVGQDENNEWHLGACQPASKSIFISTESLPRSANFD